jgi:hypothetical protein
MALVALRALVVGGRLAEASLEGADVNIGGRKFAKDAPTTWKASLGAQKGNYYSLEAIMFALQHAEASVGEYLKKARDAKLGNTFVRLVSSYL